MVGDPACAFRRRPAQSSYSFSVTGSTPGTYTYRVRAPGTTLNATGYPTRREDQSLRADGRVTPRVARSGSGWAAAAAPPIRTSYA